MLARHGRLPSALALAVVALATACDRPQGRGGAARSAGATPRGGAGRDAQLKEIARVRAELERAEAEASRAPEPPRHRFRPLAATRAEVAARRDALRARLATAEAAAITAAVEAARTRAALVAILLLHDVPVGAVPDLGDASGPQGFENVDRFLQYGPRTGTRKGGSDPLSTMIPPQFYDGPHEVHRDALDRLDYIPAMRAQAVEAVAALDEYLATQSGDGPAPLPELVARGYLLEFSLRGPATKERTLAHARRLDEGVRAMHDRLAPALFAGWTDFPPAPPEVGATSIARKIRGNDVWQPWPGTEMPRHWRRGPSDEPFGDGSKSLDQAERFRAGQPLRALVFAFEEADQILRVLGVDRPAETVGPSHEDRYGWYREQLGERIVAPFAREAATRAAANDGDGVLDALEALHALPIRVAAMARLRASVAADFPEPAADSPVEERIRAHRFRLIANLPGPEPLPLSPPLPVEEPTLDPLGEPTWTIDPEVQPLALALSPDGSRLAVIRDGKSDRIYALPSGAVAAEFDSAVGNIVYALQTATVMSFSPDGERFAVASASDAFQIYRTADWSVLSQVQGTPRVGLKLLTFGPPDGGLLAGQRDQLRFYDADGALRGGPLPYDGSWARVGPFGDDGRLVAIGGDRMAAFNILAMRVEPLLGAMKGAQTFDGPYARGIYGGRLLDLRGPDPMRKGAGSAVFAARDRFLLQEEHFLIGGRGNFHSRLVARQAPGWEVAATIPTSRIGKVGEGTYSVRTVGDGPQIVLVGDEGVAVLDPDRRVVRSRKLGNYGHALSADGQTLAAIANKPRDGRDRYAIEIWRFDPHPDTPGPPPPAKLGGRGG